MPGGYEWLIIIAVLLLLFGAKKLPDMARSVGQSARVFKGEMKGLKDDDKSAKPADAAAPPAKPLPENTPTPGTTVNGTSSTPSTPQAQPGSNSDVT